MKILILVNHDIIIHYFRSEIIRAFILNGYKVMVSCPREEKIKALESLGCEILETHIDRKGKNPCNDLKLLGSYYKMIKKNRPNIVLTFTIKPNIYGGLVCRYLRVPYIPNITGLGTALENPGFLQHLTTCMYKSALKKARRVFFQNIENRRFFETRRIALGKHHLLPGSGVNLAYYSPLNYPTNKRIEFVFISRVMKEKGIDEYLKTAEIITKKYPHTRFHICGVSEAKYIKTLHDYESKGIINYHGLVDDIRVILEKTHCTIHPSYHEGMSNVLLESSACARPIITTNKSGCKEVVDEGINGFLVPVRSIGCLVQAVERFIHIPYEQKMKMGLAGRAKVEREFDRQVVVDAYMREIEHLPN